MNWRECRARLRDERLAQGLTQWQLSQKVGVVQSMVSDWEYGRFQPKLDVVSRWIEALETELTVNVKDGNINYKIHHRRDGAVWE